MATTPSDPEPSQSSLGNELNRLDQALSDLKRSGAAEVCLVRVDTRAEEVELEDAWGRLARSRGFVTSTLSLRRTPLEALDELVKALIEHLVPPTRSGTSKKRGLSALLDAFVEQHGKKSAAILDEAATGLDVNGDLTALCRAYVSASSGERDFAGRLLEAWLAGTELKDEPGPFAVRAALSPRTARRALSELTRLLRALGFAGCFFCLTEGDAIAHRTARQRERSYTLLRELIDNFDSDRGAVTTRFLLTGRKELFEGARSVHSLPPLLSRLVLPSEEPLPPPHRSWAMLRIEPDEELGTLEPKAIPLNRARAMRGLVRVSQGLPPVEAITEMSVGHERIDRVIEKLFEHARISGSVFTILTGDYGTGKTHLLLHLTERALDEHHPVFRLDLERLNFDLGNPQRHLQRLLEDSTIPLKLRPTAMDRAGTWTRSTTHLRVLRRALEDLAKGDSEAGVAARKVLKLQQKAKDPAAVLETFLKGHDLLTKPSSPNYRQDAYSRFRLWLELLSRVDQCKGPVVLIDEAENLYTTGASRAARRAALRSLSFYCGGALPSACVAIAITPNALDQLKEEADELLSEVSEQRTLLPWEDASMLRQRLHRIKPERVPEFTRAERVELCSRVRALHEAVRGGVSWDGWERELSEISHSKLPPRAIVRRLVDALEAAWWKTQTA